MSGTFSLVASVWIPKKQKSCILYFTVPLNIVNFHIDDTARKEVIGGHLSFICTLYFPINIDIKETSAKSGKAQGILIWKLLVPIILYFGYVMDISVFEWRYHFQQVLVTHQHTGNRLCSCWRIPSNYWKVIWLMPCVLCIVDHLNKNIWLHSILAEIMYDAVASKTSDHR